MADKNIAELPQRIIVQTRDGETREIPAVTGDSLMETIRAAGIDELLAICGGCCSCGTCHVYIEDSRVNDLPPPSEDEDAVLGFSDYRQSNSRLSCQLRFSPELNSLKLSIAPED